MTWLKRLAILIIMFVASPHAWAQTPSKVALVIGNSAYESLDVLRNPRSDATLIAESLTRIGFAVTVLSDRKKAELDRDLLEFGERAHAADVALIYFAGHGVESAGRNWLLATDAIAPSNDDYPKGMPLDSVVATASRARKIGLVILDACRDLPFGATLRQTNGLSAGEGANQILILYATAQDQKALDGAGANSPFAEAFSFRIEREAVDVRTIFANVRDDVRRVTNGVQTPQLYGSASAESTFLTPMRHGATRGIALPSGAAIPPYLKPEYVYYRGAGGESGLFRQMQNGAWVEMNGHSGTSGYFRFSEVRRTPEEIELFDDIRMVRILLRPAERKVHFRARDMLDWEPLYDIVRTD